MTLHLCSEPRDPLPRLPVAAEVYRTVVRARRHVRTISDRTARNGQEDPGTRVAAPTVLEIGAAREQIGTHRPDAGVADCRATLRRFERRHVGLPLFGCPRR